ncbi:MAG: hypothetical protein U5M23_01585 [Marinagarivorans sp.]|nr:hypothetical protein [Marinagarivorans sp.]
MSDEIIRTGQYQRLAVVIDILLRHNVQRVFVTLFGVIEGKRGIFRRLPKSLDAK